MRIILNLDCVEPITLNHSIKYRIIKKFISAYKSNTYKELIKLVNELLLSGKNREQINLFNASYIPKEHYLAASYRFYYPIMTKKKLISMRSKDISNTIKPIEDAIFSHLNADDSQIISVSASKIHSEKIKSVVELEIIPLNLIM